MAEPDTRSTATLAVRVAVVATWGATPIINARAANADVTNAAVAAGGGIGARLWAAHLRHLRANNAAATIATTSTGLKTLGARVSAAVTTIHARPTPRAGTGRAGARAEAQTTAVRRYAAGDVRT